jgi:imidazole glycerol-phosphate synthase subunit HisH
MKDLSNRVGIIDVGIGNVGSVANMLRKVGNDALIFKDPALLSSFTKVILPGVGRFDKGIQALQQQGFIEPIKTFTARKDTALLGICLGMQLLFEGSEEGNEAGLGYLPGIVERFKEDIRLPVPNVGWLPIHLENPSPLFTELEQAYFYFVHAYHAPIQLNGNPAVLASTQYAYLYPSAVGKDNVYGVQFHPEKSLSFGFKLLSNFVHLQP